MKKVLKTLAVLVVLAAAGFFGYRYYQSQRVMAATSTDGVAYTEYTVSTGSLPRRSQARARCPSARRMTWRWTMR